MHKCIILIALVAFSASQVRATDESDSQRFLKYAEFESTENEMKNVQKEYQENFQEFCHVCGLRFIYNFVNSKDTDGPSVFDILYSTFAAVRVKDLDTQKDVIKNAAKDLIEELNEPNSFTPFLTRSNIRRTLAARPDKLNPGQTTAVIKPEALEPVVDALFFAVNFAANSNMETPPVNVVKTIRSACEVTTEAKKYVTETFNNLIIELSRPGYHFESGVQESLKNLKVENIGCLTVNRLFTIDKWCDFVAELTPDVMVLSANRKDMTQNEGDRLLLR